MLDRQAGVVLFSGGLDSAVVLAEAVERGLTCYPLFFAYGQVSEAEDWSAAGALIDRYSENPKVHPLRGAYLDLSFLRSSLTGHGPIPPGELTPAEASSTYVPCRNSVFLSVAVGYAESLGAASVWAGFNCEDERGVPVPDGRTVFVDAMQRALAIGSVCGSKGAEVGIVCPLMRLGKPEIALRALELGVPINKTRSCFAAGEPCGMCRACVVRADAIARFRRDRFK